MNKKIEMAKLFSDAKDNLMLFRRVFLPVEDEVKTPSFQEEWGNVLLHGVNHYAVEGFRESGKALAVSTLIPTPNGIKMMGEINAGDYVFDENGNPVLVGSTSDIFYGHNCFEVEFDTGDKVIADEDHLWTVFDKHKRRYNIVNTLELYAKQDLGKPKGGYQEKAYRIPLCSPIQFTEAKHIISPYDLGQWLGNGKCLGADITCGFNDADETVSNLDWEYKSTRRDKTGVAIKLTNGFVTELKRLKVFGDKHIPESYFYDSEQNRWCLLAGLIDADGTVDRKTGTITFTSTSNNLAYGVLYVANSLGLKTTITKSKSFLNGKKCKDHYDVSFKTTRKFLRLKRKSGLIQSHQDKRSTTRTIKRVTKHESVPTMCIKVNSQTGIFLCGTGNIPTHNTGVVLRAFPLHCLTYPDKRTQYVVFIMATQTLASKRLKEIENEWLSNELLSMDLIKIVEQSDKGFEVMVNDSNGEQIWVRFEAYGKGSSVRGLNVHDHRPDVVLIDDPQDTEDAKSDTVQDNDWDWFLSDVIFLGKKTRIFMIGNNLGEKCLIERVIDNKKDLKFTGVRIPVLDSEGNSVWPERWSTDEIVSEREAFRRVGNLDTWEREKMCIAISPEKQLFKKQYFKYYKPETLETKDMNVFTTVDLAISQKESADYTVVCTIGVNSDNHWFILDINYGRWDPTQTIDAIFDAVGRYKPVYVGVEKVAYQAALSHFIEKEMPKRNVWFTVKDLEAKEKKEERIKAIQPRFKSGTVWFPIGASFLGELEGELLSFPKALHDDLTDALAYQDQIYFAPVASYEKVYDDEIPLSGEL